MNPAFKNAGFFLVVGKELAGSRKATALIVMHG